MRHRSRYILSSIGAIFLVACQAKNNYPNRYFDYSGNDGCSPPNIGHGLGGDLPEIERNSLEGMMAISVKQSSRCFKNWEVDLNQSADAIVLSHDSVIEGKQLESMGKTELPDDLLTLDEFASAFVKLNLQKPLIFDIKKVTNPKLWPELKKVARNIEEESNISVWFIIDSDVSDAHAGICKFIGGEFDIMLYRQGGPLCDPKT